VSLTPHRALIMCSVCISTSSAHEKLRSASAESRMLGAEACTVGRVTFWVQDHEVERLLLAHR